MGCKDDDLTFPFKRNKEGVIKFLHRYRVPEEIPRNIMNVRTQDVDAEVLYWVYWLYWLLRNGLETDQVPALP